MCGGTAVQIIECPTDNEAPAIQFVFTVGLTGSNGNLHTFIDTDTFPYTIPCRTCYRQFIPLKSYDFIG